MQRSHYVIFGCCLFLISSTVSWYFSPYYFLVYACLPIITFLILRSAYPTFFSTKQILIISLGVMTLALLRVEYQKYVFAQASITQFNDREDQVKIHGIIIEEADIRSDSIRYTLQATEIFIQNDELLTIHPITGNLLAKTDLVSSADFGDVVEVKGFLETPSDSADFSYQKYLLRYGISSIMNDAELTVLEANQSISLFPFLLQSKYWFEKHINRLFNEPQASLMAGILIGSRKGIPDKLMEEFNITGLTHIIAISGYNITIIISIIMSLFGFLPRKLSYRLAIISIILFTIFVGSSAAVVRAAIMGILGLLAIQSGRTSNITVTILFSACLMVLYNPLVLWYDAGFQLSFLAVLGLVYVSPHLEKYFLWLPTTLSIRESVMMTISAQIAALPLIIFLFHRLSIISPLANLLVAPFLPFAMLFGFLAVVFLFIFPPIGWILGFIGNSILSIVLFFISLCSQIPYAAVDLPKISFIILVSYYLLLILWLIKKGTLHQDSDLLCSKIS